MMILSICITLSSQHWPKNNNNNNTQRLLIKTATEAIKVMFATIVLIAWLKISLALAKPAMAPPAERRRII